MTLTDAIRLCREAKATGKKIVFTNGVFDLLHVGHVRYLTAARELGDLLIVGLNSDASTRQLKGPDRPLVPQDERLELLEALGCVDAVVVFEETTAIETVTQLRPDVYVKGGDYSRKPLPEEASVRAYGGEVRLLDEVEGRSTTNIIEAIRERFCP